MTIIITSLLTLLLVVFVLNISPDEKKIDSRINHLYGVEDDLFRTSLGHLLGPPLIGGNQIIPLVNGDDIFPAMLNAIRNAKESICFETYIYWSGSIAHKFADALSERARAGLPVHVILDFIGSIKMKSDLLEEMKISGVQIVKYHPVRWYTITKINNRTHRKLLIIDGKIGFTGGVGIADPWLGDADSPNHWRDTQVQITGPVVADLQSAFMDNWLKTNAHVLHGGKYFPLLNNAGESLAQVFKSSADEGGESARLMFLLSISSAKRNILVSASYFVPDTLAVESLIEASNRGVDIKIIVPGPIIDKKKVQIVSRSLWKPLIENGVKIYEYQPTMFHVKTMVVDGFLSTIGSTNFDNRSFRLNDEANLNILDTEVAEAFIKEFEEDLSHSKEYTLKDWNSRTIKEKLLATVYGVFRSQL